jgi:hypothetical protein
MAHDPYRAPELAPDVPVRDLAVTTDPLRVTPAERMPSFWVPIAIAVAIVLGLSFYYVGHTNVPPNVRADSGTATQSVPSPN